MLLFMIPCNSFLVLTFCQLDVACGDCPAIFTFIFILALYDLTMLWCKHWLRYLINVAKGAIYLFGHNGVVLHTCYSLPSS
jgi:hypothetical protein